MVPFPQISKVSPPYPGVVGGIPHTWGLGPPQLNPQNTKISFLVEMQYGIATLETGLAVS